MASDRFDDVRFEFLEAPEPPPRRRHRGLVALAAAIAAGALAAGAAAHTDGPAAAARAQPKNISYGHDGHGCRHGDRHRSWREGNLRY